MNCKCCDPYADTELYCSKCQEFHKWEADARRLVGKMLAALDGDHSGFHVNQLAEAVDVAFKTSEPIPTKKSRRRS